MRRTACLLWLLVCCVSLSTAPARAALHAVSGLQAGNELTAVAANGDPTQVAVNLANGFPLWYQDVVDGRKLQLCLDPQLTVAPGMVVNPCEYEPPVFGAPPSFPGNFGAEALYWSAASLGGYVSSNGAAGRALLVLALEAAGANEAALNDGNQAVFNRIRIRVSVPVTGTYRVTHPFGSRDYVVTALDLLREWQINQTQDLGVAAPQNFLAAMNDGPPPTAPLLSSVSSGAVDTDGAGVGPFLVPANPWGGSFDPNDPTTFAGGPITVGDATYLALPFAPNPTNPTVPIDIFQPITGSAFIPDGESEPANYFRIELVAGGPDGFQLNPANAANPQRVQFDDFLLVGRLFDDRVNQIPTAVPDMIGAAMNQAIQIDVITNDTDSAPVDNAHGLNPQALALADPGRTAEPHYYTFGSGMPRLTATQPTAAGGSVRRVTSIQTGRTTFLYTPPLDYTGPDSFAYVVQDRGGLTSAPATVAMTVEELAIERADYRARVGQWHLRGTSSDAVDNRVTLYAAPRALLTPDQEVQTPAVASDARGHAALRLGTDAIEYRLAVAPLPATAVTAAHIHVGSPDTNGPVIFSLFDRNLDGDFTAPRDGTLTAVNLQARPEIGIAGFADAVAAILAGNAYVNLHTAAYPAGELRGQLRRPLIGTAPVVGGTWEFRGHTTASPSILPGLGVESANGVRSPDLPLRLR